MLLLDKGHCSALAVQVKSLSTEQKLSLSILKETDLKLVHSKFTGGQKNIKALPRQEEDPRLTLEESDF